MTIRQNTNNPCPSNALADLNDNTITIDEFVNSKNDYTVDRFGNKFQTKHKILIDLEKSISEINRGSFLPISSVHTNENGVSTYNIGNQVNFDLKPKIAGTEPIYIIESYQNGDSWYQRFSNGFIMQSGTMTIGDVGAFAGGNVTFNMITPFSTTFWTPHLEQVSINQGWNYLTICIPQIYNDRFVLYIYNNHSSLVAFQPTFRWYACGF